MHTLLRGFIFGLGFCAAVVIFGFASSLFVLPHFIGASHDPTFTNPETPDLVVPIPVSKSKYSFFKSTRAGMKLPPEGGILAMGVLSTPSGSKRPRTYQLWLTASELWQIQTDGQKPTVEKLPYPEPDPVTALHRIQSEHVGNLSGSGSTTIRAAEIERLKQGFESNGDSDLRGKLRITEKGVVFLEPDEF